MLRDAVYPAVAIATCDEQQQAIVLERLGDQTMELKDKIELLKVILTREDAESGKYWTRNGIFITIQTGLLLSYAALYAKIPVQTTILWSVIGTLIGIAWIQVARMGKFYTYRWRVNRHDMVAKDAELREQIFGDNHPSLQKPRGPSAHHTMQILAMLFVIMWVALPFFLDREPKQEKISLDLVQHVLEKTDNEQLTSIIIEGNKTTINFNLESEVSNGKNTGQ